MGFETTLWRSIAVYRVAALIYAGVLIALHYIIWVAAAVLAWAVARGRTGGAAAAVLPIPTQCGC